MKNSVFLKLDKGQRKENGWRGKHVDQLRIERCVSLEDHCPCLKQLSSKVSVKVMVTLLALPCPEKLFTVSASSLAFLVPVKARQSWGRAVFGRSQLGLQPAKVGCLRLPVLTLMESTGPVLNMQYLSVPAQMSSMSSPAPSSWSSLCINCANAFILLGLPPTQTNCQEEEKRIHHGHSDKSKGQHSVLVFLLCCTVNLLLSMGRCPGLRSTFGSFTSLA